MNSNKKIIVLTPVKNEDWILDVFLKTTSSFADHIILADQNSTDKTLEIAKKFPKVDIIFNNSKDFNEAARQKLLINTARNKYGISNVLIAIDSDEIIVFNSLDSEEWTTIRNSAPGTVLFFEKPTYLDGTENVIRYDKNGGWPLGLVDDGSEHIPQYIHSTRIPMNENSPKLFLKDIKFLHCNLISLKRQRSKVRYYCLLETIAKTKSRHHRVILYNQNYDYAKNEGNGIEKADPEWINGWIEQGISIVPKQEIFYWYDLESLKILENNKYNKFWLEDVWDVNWQEVSNHFNHKITKVKLPPKVFGIIRKALYYIIVFSYKVKKQIKTFL
jgi:glycosyltransferase involved in cell wall biosynthesis